MLLPLHLNLQQQAAPPNPLTWQPVYPPRPVRKPDVNRWAGATRWVIPESLFQENQPPTPVTTTTWCDVRDGIIAVLEALTPTLLGRLPFRHVHRAFTVRQFVDRSGSAAVRKFDLRRETVVQQLYHAARVAEQRERAVLTVAYPTVLALYGIKDHDELERVMRSDARQIRDAVISFTNWIPGQKGAWLDVLPTKRAAGAWFQEYEIRAEFLESMNII